jgi:site-specific recombinase XerD
MGRKDFVLLLLLVRLGLRCCEVAALEFEDINWRQGEITIRGKGQEERLPLPDDVGQALTRYLQIRHSTEDRHVFLRSKAPTGPLSSGAINVIVRKHLIEAAISPPRPHRLRHTAATQMLRQGATLDQVAQVLRHRSLATTVIYAKVDHDRLSALSQPWPAVAHD